MYRGFNRQPLEGFHLLGQAVHRRRQRAERQRPRPLRINNAVGFHHRIIIQAMNRAVVAGIHHHLRAQVVVDRVDKLDGHLRVVGAAAKAQLLRFFFQLRVGVQRKQLLLDFHHLFGAGALGFRRGDLFRQHRRRQPKIAMIGARNRLQRAQEFRRPRQLFNVVHRQRLTVAQHVDHLAGDILAPL